MKIFINNKYNKAKIKPMQYRNTNTELRKELSDSSFLCKSNELYLLPII